MTKKKIPEPVKVERVSVLELQEKKTKVELRKILKKRGWPKVEIDTAVQELWPETSGL
jgi:hypothetical protein